MHALRMRYRWVTRSVAFLLSCHVPECFFLQERGAPGGEERVAIVQLANDVICHGRSSSMLPACLAVGQLLPWDVTEHLMARGGRAITTNIALWKSGRQGDKTIFFIFICG